MFVTFAILPTSQRQQALSSRHEHPEAKPPAQERLTNEKQQVNLLRRTFHATAACAVVASSCALFTSHCLSAQATPPVPCAAMTIGQNASLNGFLPFLATDPWRTSVASASVDPNSVALIAQLGGSALHPDFGSGEYNGSTLGIPYVVVSGQGNVIVHYGAFASESDPGIMPVPASAWVEGYPAMVPGDRHVIVVDPHQCFLYELGNAYVQGDGSWNADVGVTWNLHRGNDRPYMWTSADAAGLPIFPGLARYDEVAGGQIQHALRFTVQHTRAAFVLPATHFASDSTSTSYLPMGARLRLKANYDISAFTPQAKVILTALKTYGMIVADNGSNLYVSGSPGDGWDNDDLHNLGRVPASAFEVIRMGTPITRNILPAGSPPIFQSLTADQTTVKAGTLVTLTWNVTGSTSSVVVPFPGSVSGNWAWVRPWMTTTYSVVTTNHFGTTTMPITITTTP